MKKYIYIIITIFVSLFYSCQYEALPTYSGTDQIYFSYSDSLRDGSIYGADSLLVQFGYDAVIKSDSIVGIGVNVMGNVVNYDRRVSFIMIDSTSTAIRGKDVELLPDLSLIPAGKNTGKIYIKLYNTENLKGKSLMVSLRLIENEYFKTDYRLTPVDYINSEGKIVSTEYRVRFDNSSEKPNMWANPSTSIYFDMVFGTYSRVKFTLMCQILPGCTREYFTYGQNENPMTVFSARFPTGLMAGWARGLNSYLIAYKDEHGGVPLYDENGNEVTSGEMFK
ncbi:MAG: DUF4843 domain-containing protein [Dysgonamonadaceae bacterium]|jgi:hypothetical protein|nr:DUF4843 domain-containing protein [Dysgonamonadaceae bacterium]